MKCKTSLYHIIFSIFFFIVFALHRGTSYTWVASALPEFTLTAFGGLAFIELVKHEWLEHPKPNVKAAAIACLVEVYKQTGPVMKDAICEGIKSGKAVEEALAKVAPEDIKAPVAGILLVSHVFSVGFLSRIFFSYYLFPSLP
jgi:hypothetical protein